MKKIITLFAALGFATLAKAVVADPTPFPYTLPDGSVTMAVLHGDEYHSYITDTEGTILRGEKITEEEYTMRRMQRAPQQTTISSNFPRTGSPRSVAILLDFQDCKFQKTREEFWNMLNQSGYSANGATGSCRDYFIACSDSVFQPHFDVWGPFTVSGTVAEYGKENGSQNDTKPQEAFIEAVQLAAESGVDFTQYDTDEDGVIDNIFFYYAGHNQAEGGGSETIWPHQSSLLYYSKYVQGKRLGSYACTSELKGYSGNTMCAIGTFCHEFGHVLGLPDLYDTENSSAYTIGSWSIMCNGNYNNNGRTPPSYSSYERYYLGWLRPEHLKTPGEQVLMPLVDTRSAFIMTANNISPNMNGAMPSPNEFFMLEYRTHSGWDTPNGALPGTGMLIWHIDYNASNWNGNTVNNYTPLRVHLEEADGSKGTSSPSDAYPGAKKVTSYIPRLHDGTTLNQQPIYGITEVGNAIVFAYCSKGTTSIEILPSELSFEVNLDDNNKPIDWKSTPITIIGKELVPGDHLKISTPQKSSFTLTQQESAIKSRTSMSWLYTVELKEAVDEDGNLEAVVYLNYNPKKRNCDIETALMTIQGEGTLSSVELSGTAPRATLVETPVVLDETNLTAYGFTANWESVKDAELYCITLYQVQEGKTEFVQGFENFTSASKIAEQGWESSTTSTTTQAKSEGQRALLFSNPSDYILSEVYPATITNVSFWVSAMAASGIDTVANLTLQATKDGQNWDKVYSTNIARRVSGKVFGVDLKKENGYTQFLLEYTDLGGNGIAIDAFTATAEEKINYITRGKEATAGPDATTYVVTGLQPNNTYYYGIQCTDLGKGCVEHMTPMSEPRKIVTLNGVDVDNNQLPIECDMLSYDERTYSIILPPYEENHGLYIYNETGHLVWWKGIRKTDTSITLPPYHFVKGRIYIAKYVGAGKLKRKERLVKFIF